MGKMRKRDESKKNVGFYFSNQIAGVGLYEMGYRGTGEIWGEEEIKSSVSLHHAPGAY